MTKLKIVSDGTGSGTHILLPGGEELAGNIQKIEWVITANDQIAYATVTFINVEIEAVGQAPEIKDVVGYTEPLGEEPMPSDEGC